MDGNAEEQVEGDLPPVAQVGGPGGGVEPLDPGAVGVGDPALVEQSQDRDETSSEIGIGFGIGVTRWMVVASRSPRRARRSCSMNAASYGAGGHLKKPPSTPITIEPPRKSGSTSRIAAAPAGE